MGYESQKTLFVTYRNGTNGTTPKDFNLTASAYAIIKDKDGNIKENGSIILTTHKMNVTGNVSWYTKTGNTETQIKIPNTNNNYIGDTYTTTSPGTYIAKILSGTTVLYQDSVTITEVQDGQTGPDGKPAISITLSNPTMTFNTSTVNESETCEVMVYEGGTKLTYGSGNGQFQVYVGEITDIDGEEELENEFITITEQEANDSQKYTVFGKTKQGEEFSQVLTIYCTFVRNGSNGSSPYSISLDNDSDTLVISSADGQWISNGCTVNATKYYGSSVQTYGYLNWSLETASNKWKLDDGKISDWNYKITPAGAGSSQAILTIRTKDADGNSVLENITEATFIATWKSGASGGTTYATKKFSVKVLSSLSDYDLIVPQTVYNKKNIITSGNNQTKVSVSVQKKSASGTESLAYNADSTICPVRIYKKTSTGYTNIGDWSTGIPFSSKTGMHLVLGSATTTTNVPDTIWDEEIIEVVEDGLSGLVLSLDNDSDVFVKKKDGTKISGNILVTAQLTRDGMTESGATFILSGYPEAFKSGTSFNTNYVEFKGATGVLTIKDIPSGFESGDFVIKASGLNLEKAFTLRAVQSNADYDLCFDKTLINNTTSGGNIIVWVNKTSEDGVVTRLEGPEVFNSGATNEKTLNIRYGSSNTSLSHNSTTGKWSTIPYATGADQANIPVKLVLENSGKNSTSSSFEWDNETIEFVQNGEAAQDFSVTASAYAFVDSTSNPVNSIELKADLKNLDGTVKWYKNNSDTQKTGKTLTIYRTQQADDTTKPYGPGTYTAKLFINNAASSWADSVTIGQITDGAVGPDGKPAISISLTNPTMVFNSKNTTEKEECKVIVYEGATTLTPGTNTEKTFSIEKDTSDTKSVISNDTITITSPGAIIKNYTIKVRPTGWKSGDPTQDSTISINCTLVDDGEDGVYISLQADPAVIHSTDLTGSGSIVFTAFEKVGGKETSQITLNSTNYSYKYKWNIDAGWTTGANFSNKSFTISKAKTGTPKTLTVQLLKDNVLIASQTVEVLYDVARREYFLYHGANGDTAPSLPTDLDWGNFREKNTDTEVNSSAHKGWYKTQDENHSYYYISKRNAYDELEQANKPWFGPMEIKQTPQTYDSWWKALDNATKNDKTKGIYTLQDSAGVQAVGINADFIKAGALTIKPKTYIANSGWVDDEDGGSVFETGWKFKKKTGNSSNDLNNAQAGDILEPYVKIGGAEFTGYVPATINQIQGQNLLEYKDGEHDSSSAWYNNGKIGPRLLGANSAAFTKYINYENNILYVGKANQSNFGTNEAYYRLCVPNINNLWGLKPGSSYTISGEALLSGLNSTKQVLYLRNQYSKGEKNNGQDVWYDNNEIPIFTPPQTINLSYVSFSKTFTVPNSATGFYCSFQVKDSTSPSIVGTNNFKGYFHIKNLKLVENSPVNASGNFSWKFDPQDGLMMWSGQQGTGNSSTDSNLMFKIYKDDDEGKLWLKGDGEFTGKIFAEAGGRIGGWYLQDYTDKNHPEAYKLTAGNFNSDGFIGLYTAFYDDSYTINGHSDGSWRMIIGKNFGINNYGALYATAGSFGGMVIENGAITYAYTKNNEDGSIKLSNTGLSLKRTTGGSENTELTHGAIKITTSDNDYILLNTDGLIVQNRDSISQTCILNADGVQWADNGQVGEYSTQRAKIYYDTTNSSLAFYNAVDKTTVLLKELASGSVFKGPYFITTNNSSQYWGQNKVGVIYISGNLVFGQIWANKWLSSASSFYFRDWEKGAFTNLPGPNSTFEIKYTGQGTDSLYNNLTQVIFQNEGGNLKISCANLSTVNYQSLYERSAEYFVYSTKQNFDEFKNPPY